MLTIGIMPVADKLPYSVVDNKLTIDSIQTNKVEGDIFLDGSITVDQNFVVRRNSEFNNDVSVDGNFSVGGEIKANTIYVENLIAKTERELKEPLVFSNENGGVLGKGIVWKHDEQNIDVFIYRNEPNRIFTNLSLDLHRSASLMIDGTPVFNADTLGPSIVNSNLRKVGRLKNLTVDGDVILGEHIFLDTNSGRVGFGTDHANAAFSLVDSNIELILGSINTDEGNIGTFTSDDLGLVTDGVTRMKITRTGKVIFGDARSANADVTINGRLFVKELIVNTQEERQSPLEFKAVGQSNYGKGMIFTGEGLTKQFLFAAQPDQFYSTEHINIQKGKSYHIDRNVVLSENSLGESVTSSNLTKLGTLSSLTVAGNVNLGGAFGVVDGKVLIGQTTIDASDGLSLMGSKFTLASDTQSITITDNNINLGDKQSPTANVIVNGKLGIGIQTNRDDAQFEVAGNIRFADKLFMVGSAAPSQGTFKKGDIVWNENPLETGYVGWVCVRSGNPGVWRGFGQIGVE